MAEPPTPETISTPSAPDEETLAEPPEQARKRLPEYETVSGAVDASLESQATHCEPVTVEALPLTDAARLVRRATRRIALGLGRNLRDASPLKIGAYEVRELLGEGGGGQVFAAWDSRHQREVALKLMFRSDVRGRQRYERELHAIAKLRHPHIVPLIDSGEHEGRPYLVMERVHGANLAEVVRCAEDGEAELSLHKRVELLRDVARAIHHAHSLGILHRDLKPQNVLLDQHGEPLVVDFGLARGHEDVTLTHPGAPLGTPAYMPPEQAGGFGGQVSVRSDVYGLGATLYHLLSGRPPFQSRGEELMLMVLQGNPDPVESSEFEIPADLRQLVARCLEKAPQDRYESAEALALDLERWLRGEPLHARRADPLQRFLRYARANRATVVLIVGIVLSLIVNLFFLLRQWGGPAQ